MLQNSYYHKLHGHEFVRKKYKENLLMRVMQSNKCSTIIYRRYIMYDIIYSLFSDDCMQFSLSLDTSDKKKYSYSNMESQSYNGSQSSGLLIDEVTSISRAIQRVATICLDYKKNLQWKMFHFFLHYSGLLISLLHKATNTSPRTKSLTNSSPADAIPAISF